MAVSNTTGNYNEILIGFLDGATNKYDNKYDGYKLKGNTNLALYTKLVEDDGKDYAIQALPPLTDGVTVKAGVDAGTPGFFTFNVVNIENFNDTTSILLEDLAEKTVVNLRENPEYHFAINNPGAVTDRFLLHFNTSAVGMEEIEWSDQPLVYVSNGRIIIKSQHESDAFQVEVFDVIGRSVPFSMVTDPNQTTITLKGKISIYIIKIRQNKHFFTKKVYWKGD